MALECERWQWRELVASEHGPSDPSTRLVLFVLSLHMNQDGNTCFPAQESIAKRAALSVRSVRTHLALAAKAQWLQIYRKPKKGQAWYVHEYVATIPDDLAQFCTTKPWEEDPDYKRPENSAGRPKGSKSGQRPANGAERPAILAPRPANGDSTTGNLRHDDRQNLPTNSSSNSSMNSPMNTSWEGAAASGSPAGLVPLNRKSKTEESQEARESKAAKLLQATPDISTASLAKMFDLTEKRALKMIQDANRRQPRH